MTQLQWRHLVGRAPEELSHPDCDDGPIEGVNWHEACAYANALSRREGLPEAYFLKGCRGKLGGRNFSFGEVRIQASSPYASTGWRLPTEAEWERACRAGSLTLWFFGADFRRLGAYAWFGTSCNEMSHPVGLKRPNAWGLQDMAGSVTDS